MNTVSGRTAIVTGASSGIGYETALLFAEAGANVVVTSRRADKLDALVSQIESSGGRAIAVAGDIRDEVLAESTVEAAMRHFGRLDIAFNNAGTVGELAPLNEATVEHWDEIIDTNLRSAFLCAKHQFPAMRRGGSVVFTSSFVGYTAGLAGMSAYAASKAGLIGLTKALAAEYGPGGIRVNAILPGGTDTPASLTRSADAGPEVKEFVEGIHALKRMAAPREIAQSVLYLASDASSFTTGTAMLVDGGASVFRG